MPVVYAKTNAAMELCAGAPTGNRFRIDHCKFSRILQNGGDKSCLPITMSDTKLIDADFQDSLGIALFEGRQRKTIVVVDMVESVRLIAQDEAGVVERWKRFTHRVRTETLPPLGGMLVKSLGDGMMLTFDKPCDAVAAAREMRRVMDTVNAAAQRASVQVEPIILRTGIHRGEVVADDVDIYGHSANLAARITSLGGPGEIIVSADVREHLTDGLDGHIEDLGECYLKHVNAPVRIYRVGYAGAEPVLPSRTEYEEELQPGIAVIPFESRSTEPGNFAIGELIADGVIAQIGRNADLRIISRLSSRVFRGRKTDADRIGGSLGVHYVLSGAYVALGDKLVLTMELADTRSEEIVWAERMSGSVQDLLNEHSDLIDRIANGAVASLRQAALKRVQSFPPPTLESYALMLGGINLMHRTTQQDFARSQRLLAHVIERHPKSVTARAWLAKSYVLGSVTGFGAGLVADGRAALDLTHRALDINPDDALSLAVQGYVHCHLLGDSKMAMQCLDAAVHLQPNEPMAWLFRSVVCAMWGSSEESVASARQAELISPKDPLGYFFSAVKASRSPD